MKQAKDFKVENNKTGIEIAVIGMAVRFPGAANIKEFWDNLKNGVESILPLSDEEFERFHLDKSLLANPKYVKTKGGYLEGKEYFDADFFGFTPNEAEVLDPQIRIFLECTWEALEDAGYIPDSYPGYIGLYAGGSSNLHWKKAAIDKCIAESIDDLSMSMLIDETNLCTLTSYKLNLKGPSIFLQSACSTSLVAVHLACQGILNRDCDIALAGGTTIATTRAIGYIYQTGMIFSPDGHCRAFDADSKGVVGGEGAGVVVLKALDEAVADRDHIYAVVKSTAVNNDGARKVGFTAPGVIGQAEVIKIAHQLAQVEAESISYIETHGTGTEIGDPIEIAGLKRAFRIDTGKQKICAIGSVKTNFGHLGSAAGIAGFIKTVLALENRQIPPSLNFQKPNPKIDFENSPFYVNTRLSEWLQEKYPLRAGVSAFGIGGTNAHAVLEEMPRQNIETDPREWKMILLSANKRAVLEEYGEKVITFLKNNRDIDLADIAYTLQIGRKALKYRRMVVARSAENAAARLMKENGRAQLFEIPRENPSIIFMFSGQGSLYENLGAELYRNELFFRSEVDKCLAILKQVGSSNIKPFLFTEDNNDIKDRDITRQDISQMMLFIFEYALARLLMHWGIKQQAMIGFSIGEYVAACLSGVFSLADAIKIVAIRSEVMQQSDKGVMLSVPLPERKIKDFLKNDEEIAVAVDNGSSCIVSGSIEAITKFESLMKTNRYVCMRLNIPLAGHNKLLKVGLTKFENSFSEIHFMKPQIPYISTVTGTWIKDNEAMSPGYWVNHLISTVRFTAGIEKLVKDENKMFVEIGPGSDLCALARRYLSEEKHNRVINLMRSPQGKISEIQYFYNKIGHLWLNGAAIDWEKLYIDEKRRRIPLPTYPFQRHRFWFVDEVKEFKANLIEKKQPGIKSDDVTGWFYLPNWERSIEKQGKNLEENGVWLLFINNNPFALRLVKELQAQKQVIVIVRRGKRFERIDNREYIINPGNYFDYLLLFEKLKDLHQTPQKVLHLWNDTYNKIGEISYKSIDAKMDIGFFSLINIAKAIHKHTPHHEFEIILVTNQVFEITGEEHLDPVKATVLAPVKVIPQESPNIHCRIIDMVITGSETQIEKNVSLLLKDFSSENYHQVTAYRGDYPWALKYKSAPPVKHPGANILREKGVYLIIGGLGRIGAILTGYLAEKYKARLILTGRLELPAYNLWDEWLISHDADDRISKRIKTIRKLEMLDARVLYKNVDVTDYTRMKQLIEHAEAIYGEMNGIIYAAADHDEESFSLVNSIDKNRCIKNFNSKIYGVLVLNEILKERHVDFCLLMSSISSILGGLGFAGYAAANIFMDHFVAWNKKNSRTTWTSVNWDGWELEDQENIGKTDIGYSLAEYVMSQEKGIECFERIVNRRQTGQIIQTPGNLDNRIQQWLERGALYDDSGRFSHEAAPKYERPDILTPYTPPHNKTELKLVDIWTKLFGFKNIGIEDDFFELGGDSLKAISVLSGILKELNVTISLKDFFQRRNIKELSDYIRNSDKTNFSEIKAVEKKEFYKLSSAQKRLYYLQSLNPESIAYNEPIILILEGTLDLKKIDDVFLAIIKRHDCLRTAIEIVDDQPMQKIYKNVNFNIGCSEAEENRVNVLIRDFIKPFDLSIPPFMRAQLIKVADNRFILIVDKHHIITDGVSHNIFSNEILGLYMNRELPHLKLQYHDYSEFQDSSIDKDSQKKFWLNELSGEMAVADLPYDFPRPGEKSFRGDRLSFSIKEYQYKGLKNISLTEDVTSFMMLLAVYNVMLSKLCGSEDIVIGTPIMGRNHPDLNYILGIFINTLILRNYPHRSKTFKEFLRELKWKVLNALDSQDFQFEELVNELKIKRDKSRNPIFEIVFVLQNIVGNPGDFTGEKGIDFFQDSTRKQDPGGGLEEIERSNEASAPGNDLDLQCTPYRSYSEKKAKFDLTLNIVEADDRFALSFEYCTDLFRKQTVQRFIRYFKRITSGVIENPDVLISDIEILSAKEKKHILFEFNKLNANYPEEKPIMDFFEFHAAKNRDRIAVAGEMLGDGNKLGTGFISYNELAARCSVSAGILAGRGVESNVVVGLIVYPSIEMIIGILSILKAGGCYLPIDPQYPQERINYLLADSSTEHVLAQHNCTEKIPAQCLNPIDLEDIDYTGGDNIQGNTAPGDAAYIIYTSGTSGKPKGTIITQSNVVQLLKCDRFLFDFKKNDVWTMFHSFCFDFSVWEIFGALLNGSKLVIVPRVVTRDPRRFLSILEKEAVTILNQTPSAFYNLIDVTVKSSKNIRLCLRYVIFGGEALSPIMLKEWNSIYSRVKLINMYGITETTVHVTFREIDRRDIRLNTSNIGRPLPPLTAYILDKSLHLTPQGVAGELFIAGAGLGRGYLNRPELSSEKFIEGVDFNEKRLYRSGDLARIDTKGNMEYIGRLDNQVQIRGFRIELAEVERCLLTHDTIKKVVVLPGENNQYLCAYIVTSQPLTGNQVREYLLERIPEYMIPAYFEFLESLPLTTNGKIARHLLPKLPKSHLLAPTDLPQSAIEKELQEIISQVLGEKKLTVNDDFFMNGGDSIKAIQVSARMNKLGLKLDVKDILQFPSIAEMSKKVRKIGKVSYQGAVTGDIPLTPIQHYFFGISEIDRHHFNQAVMLFSQKGFNVNGIRAVFKKIQEHHDALRITFTVNEINISQENHGIDFPLSFQEYDLQRKSDSFEIMEQKINDIQGSIDLKTGPLLKIALFRLDDGDRLLITIHHLVVDAVSWQILLEDFNTLYRQYIRGEELELPPRTMSYRRWAKQLMAYANSPEFLKEKSYWKHLESAPVAHLKKENEYKQNFVWNTKTASFTLGKKESKLLLTRANYAFRTESNDILLTALGLALGKVFAMDRVLIALEGHGREAVKSDMNLTRTVGWFTSIYPVILELSPHRDVIFNLKEVKEILRKVPQKGIGYSILKYLTPPEKRDDVSFNLKPQISFNYLGEIDYNLKKKSLNRSFDFAKESFGQLVGPGRHRLYDFEIIGLVIQDRLTISVSYDKDSFDEKTIESFMHQYHTQLIQIITLCSRKKRKELIPSDLTYKELSMEELESLTKRYSIVDIYTLTPMQEGMLFHSIYEKKSQTYFEQISYRLHGKLDINWVKESLRVLFKRHDVLRTVFIYEGFKRPLQLVLNNREVEIAFFDLTINKEIWHDAEVQLKIDEIKDMDRKRSFDLSKDVLLRVIIIQVEAEVYELIWSHHHILMDGWGVGILTAEFLEIYRSFLERDNYNIPAVIPFKKYVQWIEEQNNEEAGRYWRKYLESYNNAVSFPKKEENKKMSVQYKNEEIFYVFPGDMTAGLNHFSIQNQITLNTIIQTVWGIILGKYNSRDDVVFAVVSSGRPPEIEGIESMVGLFINTIPVRIRFDDSMSMNTLLRKVQQQAIASMPYHYYPLSRIRSECGIEGDIFDHNIAFENYPINTMLDGFRERDPRNSAVSFKISRLNVFEQTGHDLNIVFDPGRQLAMIIKYNGNVYDSRQVEKIPGYFYIIFEQILADEKICIKKLTLLSKEEEEMINSRIKEDIAKIDLDFNF